MVNSLLGVSTLTLGTVREAPPLHRFSETSHTCPQAVEGCPLLSWQVVARDICGILNVVVEPVWFCCSPLFPPPCLDPGSSAGVSWCNVEQFLDMCGERATGFKALALRSLRDGLLEEVRITCLCLPSKSQQSSIPSDLSWGDSG